MHLAVVGLQAGDCGAAQAAGVMLRLVPQGSLMVQRAGLAASDGRCKVGRGGLVCPSGEMHIGVVGGSRECMSRYARRR